MTWIKICGITNVEDALAAVEAGADALGFVFYDKSPRNIRPERAREIIQELPGDIEKVGVFVNDSTARPRETALSTGLTAIQHHLVNPRSFLGTDAIDFPGLLDGLELFIALPAEALLNDPQNPGLVGDILERVRAAKPAAARSSLRLLLDSGTPDKPGGTGQVFDWEKAMAIAEEIKRQGLKLVLSGGLKPDNVHRAIELLQPWGVDVSSGVEAMPGKKDPLKIRNFITSVRKVGKRAFKSRMVTPLH